VKEKAAATMGSEAIVGEEASRGASTSASTGASTGATKGMATGATMGAAMGAAMGATTSLVRANKSVNENERAALDMFVHFSP
jgi:hypothetical protein